MTGTATPWLDGPVPTATHAVDDGQAIEDNAVVSATGTFAVTVGWDDVIAPISTMAPSLGLTSWAAP